MDGAGFAVGRVAVLVDGDNIRADHADAIMAGAQRYGQADIRRVYGNVGNLPGWEGRVGFRFVHACGAKNTSDMQLVIEAMALAYDAGVTTFVIASSDTDFAPLGLHLRERGLIVIGMGEAKATARFRAACSEFVELCALPVVSGPSKIEEEVCDLIRKAGALRIQEMGGRLGKVPPGVRNWRAFLDARPTMFACDPKSPDARVRLLEAAR